MKAVIVKNVADIAPYAGPNAIPGIRFRPARQALGVSSWGMNVIELDPHCSGYPQHDHGNEDHEEVYVVLKGTLVIQADGEEQTLSQGDLARVPPEVKRKLVTRDQGAVVLALGGTPGKAYAPAMGRPAS
jgi:quercetin dioxygenase-like cupin family protein